MGHAMLAAMDAGDFEPPLDPGIAGAVLLLLANDVETFESCQGGAGHAYPQPTVRFEGGPHEGFRVLSLLMLYALPISDLRRVWYMQDGEPVGPIWEITFSCQVPVDPYIADIAADHPAPDADSLPRYCSRRDNLCDRGTPATYSNATPSSPPSPARSSASPSPVSP